MAARHHCGVYTYVDGLITRAPIRFYIDTDQIAAIEVYDSFDGVNEPFIGHPFIDPATKRPVYCGGLILVWSKHYQQLPWAGH